MWSSSTQTRRILNDNFQYYYKRLKKANKRYWAGDNISGYLHDGEKEALIEELTPKFEAVLDGLIIDRYNDPNSMDTGRRLAKMYINELMSGTL